MRARLGAVAAAATLAIYGMSAPASAAGMGSVTCHGDLVSGTYHNVTVRGSCTVPDGARVTIRGNVAVPASATFDASTHSRLTVRGNVTAGRGATVSLGCTTPHPCDDGLPGKAGDDTVRGNITLVGAFNAAINGVTVGGNVTSLGGGAGTTIANEQFIPFSLKDDVIHGNVTVIGLNTTWFGVIRTTIGGNVLLLGITGANPDSNEVVHDTIGKNLICFGNTPAPQLGDAVDNEPPGYGPSVVGGYALGQCAQLAAT